MTVGEPRTELHCRCKLLKARAMLHAALRQCET